tara:strand:- start:10414 stop:10797 length:384 start_codon:yes stop_codon:yes gene_type:complete
MSEILTSQSLQLIFKDLGSLLAKIEGSEYRITVLEARIDDQSDNIHSMDIRISHLETSEKNLVENSKELLDDTKDLTISYNLLKKKIEELEKQESVKSQLANRKNKLLIALLGVIGGTIPVLINSLF